MKFIEAVPNFSLGRKKKDFLALKKVLSATDPQVKLLDYSTDFDHHRTVATLVGSAAGLKKVIIKAAQKALELADIRSHQGVHPKIGVVDVVPLVPLKNVTMAECVALARETGKILAEKFRIPVYLYGKASSRPGRENLAEIRQGGLKNLARKIATPSGRPDFGPGALNPRAGAVVVGARNFLIAFNVNLATQNLEIAQKIAQKIREKDGGLARQTANGGLAGIKAIGLPIKSKKCVQVSVNICDFKKTGLMKLMTKIRKLAKIFKVKIINSEIIGLLPGRALKGVDPEFLALPGAGQKGRRFKDKFEGLLYQWS